MIKKLAILTAAAAVLAGCSGDGDSVNLGTAGAANTYAGEYTGVYTLPGQRDTTKDLALTVHSDGSVRGAVDGTGAVTGSVNPANGGYTLRFFLPNMTPFTDTGTLTKRTDGSIGGAGTATPVAGGATLTTSLDLG